MSRLLLTIATALVLSVIPAAAGAASAGKGGDACKTCAAALDPVLADPRRQDDRARDPWRHPAETLAFFRVRPGMTVVDYVPGGGWFTRVLVPYLGERGRYIGLNPDVTGGSEQLQQNLADLAKTFPAKAAAWTGVPAARIAAYNSDGVPAALKGRVDRVLIFRWLHNMQRNGMAARELATIRSLLRPDGLLGIEEHRAKADAPDAYVDGSKGYMRQKDVIALVEAQGFQLVAASEINANPKDTADYPAGVWALPPTFALGQQDRDRYAAIGESDRMTLLFRKKR